MTNATPSPTPAPDPAGTPAPDSKLAPAPDPKPAADPKAGGDPKTIVGAGGDQARGADPAADPAAGPKGDWAENWRELLAGEDKDDLKTLVRLSSPVDLWKQNKELRRKMSSGELTKVLGADATPEEKAAWRKENGFPDKPEGYLEALSLPNGVVLGDEDKPIVSELAAAALEGDVKPAAFSGLVAKYYALQDAERAKEAEADATYHDENVAALSKEYGAGYKREIALVNSFLGQFFPPDVASELLSSRAPKSVDEKGNQLGGRMWGDNPAFIKAIATLAREFNPLATLVPGGGADPAKTVNDRLAEIRKFRVDNPDKYDADKKMQAEELELLDAKQKIENRGKAA